MVLLNLHAWYPKSNTGMVTKGMVTKCMVTKGMVTKGMVTKGAKCCY